VIQHQDVVAAVDEVGALLRADGADLRLLDADPKTARIRLQLVIAGADCEECVLPPDMLRDVIDDSLRRRVHEEFELVIDDPRRGA
jgi:Fe-S cluster biogenesis protein NfuA